MKLDAPYLENDVISLEVLTEAHREPLRAAGAADAMWTWMPVIATGTSFDGYFDYVLKQQEYGHFIPFSIWRKSDRKFAGVAGFLDIDRTHRRLRIGYIWHPEEMRGTDIHPATQLALIERALEARIRRIEFRVAESNERAVKAALRLGAVREGVMRNYIRIADGSWANMVMLSLIDTEADGAMAMLKDRIHAFQSD